MQRHQHICCDILCILWIYLCVRPHTAKKIWAKLTVILTRQPVGIQASSDKETNCERVDLAAEMIEELLLVWGFWDITSRQRLIKGSSRGCNSSLYDLHTQKSQSTIQQSLLGIAIKERRVRFTHTQGLTQWPTSRSSLMWVSFYIPDHELSCQEPGEMKHSGE